MRRLEPASADHLRDQPFTYSPVGGTRAAPYPSGFHVLDETFDLGRGDAVFERAASVLMTWRMHMRAGFRVAASADRVHEGAVVLCRWGPLRVPCRVVWALEETDAVGFAYGTLPGHPESGEEAFVVRRRADTVTLTITAYSRPGGVLTRLAGPAGRQAQRLAARRYAAVLRR